VSDVVNKRKTVDSKDLDWAQVTLNDQLSQNWEKTQNMKDTIHECEEIIERAEISCTLYRATKHSKIVFEKQQHVNLDLRKQWIGQLDLIKTQNN